MAEPMPFKATCSSARGLQSQQVYRCGHTEGLNGERTVPRDIPCNRLRPFLQGPVNAQLANWVAGSRKPALRALARKESVRRFDSVPGIS
jgi:hypothetical protein